MKIHTSKIVTSDILQAVALAPGAQLDKLDRKGSRSRSVAFDITLTSDGTPDQHGNRRNRRVNAGTSQSVDRFDLPTAASWSDWGHVLGYLYALDPDMITPYYADRADFDRRTGGRFVYSYVGGDGAPVLSPQSAERLAESSVNLSISELVQHGW